MSAGDFIEVDCKDLTTRYANDVIASCAFGLKVDSLTDVNNQFYSMGKVASNFKFKQFLQFFLMVNLPKLATVSNIKLLEDILAQPLQIYTVQLLQCIFIYFISVPFH